jgi:hypothetical protein
MTDHGEYCEGCGVSVPHGSYHEKCPHPCLLKYCRECGAVLQDDDIHTVREGRGEFWGAPCYEEVIIGYNCPACGHYEGF